MSNGSVEVGTGALSVLHHSNEAVAGYFDLLAGRMGDAPPKLVESILYSLRAGGKRLRPALVLECARACGDANPAANPSALAAAGAMELIHTFSLVHDDLPAMDDDDLRRGLPTNQKVFGEAMAILAGDAMVTLAFEAIAVDADRSLVPALVRELAHASGPLGMIGGQVLDMDAEGRRVSVAELRRLHAMKTGALLTASCRLGAIAAGAGKEQLNAVTSYGRHLGLAFQIMDDILDETASPEQMGKATGKDAAKGKNTYPVLLGLEESRAAADEQLAAAIDALHPLGSRGEGLKSLAIFVVERTS